MGKDGWKNEIVMAIMISAGILLFYFQVGMGIFNFMNVWSQRIFTCLVLFLISLGIGYGQEGIVKVTKWTFVTLLVPLVAFGGLLWVNDVANGTTITAGAGGWYALDVLGTVASILTVIVSTIVQIVPYVVLVISIVHAFAADSPDEYGTAAIEFVIAVVMLVAFYFLGGLFGFS